VHLQRITVNLRARRWILATEFVAAICTAALSFLYIHLRVCALRTWAAVGLGFMAGLFVRDRLDYLKAPEVYRFLWNGKWEEK